MIISLVAARRGFEAATTTIFLSSFRQSSLAKLHDVKMRLDLLASILALPACLRLACAEQYEPDDAIYDSGLHGPDQDVLGVPCPDYTKYATARQ